MPLPSILNFTKDLVQSVVKPGDAVIDATVGNGHDTLFLAKLVGSEGTVYGFDIQPEAIDNTMKRLADAKQFESMSLHQLSHAQLKTAVPAIHHGQIRAVMFNLGYLPKGDKQTITLPESTLAALDAAFRLLSQGGLITAVVYPGHPGGELEAVKVQEWAAALPFADAQVIQYQLMNVANRPPFLVAVMKK